MRCDLSRSITTALVLGVAASACGPADDAAPRVDTAPAAMTQPARQPGVAPVPPELVQQLRAEYPVLREARAPEPQPGADAAPEQVPERVRASLRPRVLERVTGGATFYADKFEGRRTASGIPFRQNQMVAAHRAYPFGTLLRVTNLANDREVNVRVVDRGPFGGAANARRTVLDLSRRAATQLGYTDEGRARVRVEVLEWGEGLPRAS